MLNDVRTCPQRRYEAMSEDVTWRNVEVIDWKQMGPPALMTSNDILNDVKVDTVDILNILKESQGFLIYIHVLPETKRERWLIDYLYSILWYFILINIDMIL